MNDSPPRPTSRSPPPGVGEARAFPVPDEVTLAFALAVDPNGPPRTLSEPMVLASMLCAVDAARSGRSLLGGKGERIEAVSPVYWPLLVLPGPLPDRVAVFDGTGVWRNTFRHSILPPLDRVRASLESTPPKAELVAWVRSISGLLSLDAGFETFTAEGSLPVGLPLFADILAQSGFPTEPVGPHAAFLPTRRPVEWYRSVVKNVGLSLERFDSEIDQLSEIRQRVAALQQSTEASLEAERKRVHQVNGDQPRHQAYDEMDREAEVAFHSLHEEIKTELGRIRTAHRDAARARASARVAEMVAQRAVAQGRDPSQARERAWVANESARTASRTVAEAHQRIARLHERERQAYHALTARVASVEQRLEDDVAGVEIVRTETGAAFTELLAIIDDQVARRAAEREALSKPFITAPALRGVQVLWFPLWIATLHTERSVRFVVFPPMRVRTEISVGGSIRTLLGGLVLPLEPMTAGFRSNLTSTIERALADDPWLAQTVRTLVRAADSTADPEFLPRLSIGLRELREAGWMSAEQERHYYEAGAEHVRQRPPSPPTLEDPASAALARYTGT